MRVSPLFVACGAWLVALAASEEDDHEGHDHSEEVAYEWAGIFEVPKNVYMWTAQKVKGEYVDPGMKLVALPATAATEEALTALKEEGLHALGEECINVSHAGVITPKEDTCYQLQFDADLWQSLFKVDTTAFQAVAFFTEHVPTEFESTDHYLKDSTGEDIEPAAELTEESAEGMTSELWAFSLVGAFLVNLMTLVGVVLAVPAFKKAIDARKDLIDGVLYSFAAGALLACAFFLLLFEATHLVATGWDTEVDQLWRWGAMCLAGFITPVVFDAIAACADKSGKQADGDTAAVSGRSRVRVVSAILLGDFMHNLCDGFFIGAAFKGCGADFGWGVSVATVLHELPQELADYAVLVGDGVGLKSWQALLANFVTGLSVMLGVIIVNSSEVSDSGIGLLLAYGGGTYLYVAAVECMGRVINAKLTAEKNLGCLFSFIVGSILIGLILIGHEHCSPDGHAHGH